MEVYGYTFGTEMQYYRPGHSITRYANDLITWEGGQTSLTWELSSPFFDELHLLADYFEEVRENILQTRSDKSLPPWELVTIPQGKRGSCERARCRGKS